MCASKFDGELEKFEDKLEKTELVSKKAGPQKCQGVLDRIRSEVPCVVGSLFPRLREIDNALQTMPRLQRMICAWSAGCNAWRWVVPTACLDEQGQAMD